jgi:hypothetical protein
MRSNYLPALIAIATAVCAGVWVWWRINYYHPGLDQKARAITALSECKQHGLAMTMYLLDHQDTFPNPMTREHILRSIWKNDIERLQSYGGIEKAMTFVKLNAQVTFNTSLAGKKVKDEGTVWMRVGYEDPNNHKRFEIQVKTDGSARTVSQ